MNYSMNMTNNKPVFDFSAEKIHVDALQTLLDWVRWSASMMEQAGVFFGHGTETAWDEAVALVLQVLHLPIEPDSLVFQARVTANESQRLLSALSARIEQRVPLPYITGRAWLGGLEFLVSRDVLIPRSPFMEWIERGFAPWITPESVARVLEIGTGSGCLAIAAAYAFEDAMVDAVDISPAALAIATQNCQAHGMEERVQLIESDVFSAVEGRYDLIISNPPYVSKAEMEALPPEYGHEPELALTTGDQGLAIVARILADAARHLTPQGILVVEVGFSQAQLMARYPDYPFTWLIQSRGGQGLFMLTQEQLSKL